MTRALGTHGVLKANERRALGVLSRKKRLLLEDVRQAHSILLNVRSRDESIDPNADLLNLAVSALQEEPPLVSVETRAMQTTANITVEISERVGVRGLIWNGHDGEIAYARLTARGEWTTQTLIRFDGSIDAPVQINQKVVGIAFTLGADKYTMSTDDAMYFFKTRYGITGKDYQHLREILDYYISNARREGDLSTHANSPITVADDVILVNWKTSGKVKEILRILKDYEKVASHVDAYKAMLSWTLLAPLHFYMKTESLAGVKCPLLLNSGKTGSGKTGLAQIFIGLGFDFKQSDYFYTFNRVKTLFMLSVHLSESNIPCLIDDVPIDWIEKHIEDMKSYAHSGIFGDRGQSNLMSKEYAGQRSFLMTINADYAVDTDLALSTRLGIFMFGGREAARTARDKYQKLFVDLPKGFMIDLFNEIYDHRRFSEILDDVEKFNTTKEWFHYGLAAINELCLRYGIEPFGEVDGNREHSKASNAMEVALSFVAEWERANKSLDRTEGGEGIKYRGYNSPIEGEYDLDELQGRIYIHFTAPALKYITKKLSLPYKNATNFMNNIDSSDEGVRVENEGKMHQKRMLKYPTWVFTISIPIDEEGKA